MVNGNIKTIYDNQQEGKVQSVLSFSNPPKANKMP